MRWIWVAVFAAFSPLEIYALDVAIDEISSVAALPEAAPGVTISAIPAPMPVIEVIQPDSSAAVRKQRLAKKKSLPVMMLSRTERRQAQILVADSKSGEPGLPGHSYNPNDDFQGGPDELDFHRSYSRPKLISDADEADDAPALSPYVRLRLLMARLKALEVHALNQVPDPGDDLSEPVLERLKAARLKAVEAHRNKFS